MKNLINKNFYNKENFIMIINNISQVYKDRNNSKQNVRNFNKTIKSNKKDQNSYKNGKRNIYSHIINKLLIFGIESKETEITSRKPYKTTQYTRELDN